MYENIIDLCTENKIGTLVIDENNTILDVNNACLFYINKPNRSILNKNLLKLCPFFYNSNGELKSGNIKFSLCKQLYIYSFNLEYKGKENCTLITINDTSTELVYKMFYSVMNMLNDSICICDEYGNIIFANDMYMKTEFLLSDDIIGKNVTSVYKLSKDSSMLCSVLKSKKPNLNTRQTYETKYGRVMDRVGDIYPICIENHLNGAVSILKDYSKVDELTKKIVDLQEKLNNSTTANKPRTKSLLTAKYKFDDIVYKSSIMMNLIERCKRVAKSDSSVLIYGETGTGKELFAQSIHNHSNRSSGPFIAINCAALPETLLESILFGTVKGAFSGAENRIGLFEQANKGTLLLDELNSMSLSLQSKLLRVMQDGMVRKVGDSCETKVDVRIISNMNIPPMEAIEKKILREDLFYRLGVINITIPPLYKRITDIPLLIDILIKDLNKTLSKNVSGISEKALNILLNYTWPGNVRELHHTIEYSMNIVSETQTSIEPEHLPERVFNYKDDKSDISSDRNHEFVDSVIHYNNDNKNSLKNMLDDVEKQIVINTLKKYDGNISRSAKALNLHRQGLQYRINKFNITI